MKNLTANHQRPGEHSPEKSLVEIRKKTGGRNRELAIIREHLAPSFERLITFL